MSGLENALFNLKVRACLSLLIMRPLTFTSSQPSR